MYTAHTVFDNGITNIALVIKETPADRLAVTFAPYDSEGVSAAGYAEHFFTARGWDVLVIKCYINNWYQDLSAQALKKIIDDGAAYREIVTLGSGMGGYAALYFGSYVGATRMIAFSPQASADPRIVPWEERWAADRSRIRFEHASIRKSLRRSDADVIVIHDPHAPDRRHVEELARASDALRLLPIAYSGDPVDRILDELDLFESLLDTLLIGDISFDRRLFRRLRKDSDTYRIALADACRARGRADTAEAVLAQALDTDRNPMLLLAYSDALYDNGKPEAALLARREGTERLVPDPRRTARLGALEEEAGDLAAAARSYARAVTLDPGAIDYYVSEIRVLRTMLDEQPEFATRPSTMAGNEEGLAMLDRLKQERRHGTLGRRNIVTGLLAPVIIAALFLLVGRSLGWL